MKLKSLFILVFVGLLLFSCTYNNKEELYQDFPQECTTTGMTYTNTISSIVSQNCLACHATGGIAAPVLETIDQLKANEAIIKDLISRPLGDTEVMPKGGPMQKCSIDQVLAWYADGAPL